MLKKIILITCFSIFAIWLTALLVVQTERHEYATLTKAEQTAAQAYLEGKITATPSNWQWQTFSIKPGVILRAGKIEAQNSKGTVIVVPGFTGSIEMIMREIVRFHNAGYSVAAIEYRGQGLSYRALNNPEKGYVEDYALLAQEVAEFAKSIRENEKPLFFYSISMGAHITMRMALEQEIEVDAYALMVPMIKINTGELDYGSLRNIAKVMHALGLGAMYAPGQAAYAPEQYGVATPCNANPDTAQSQGAMFALNEKLRTRGSTVKWLHETFESTDVLLSKKAAEKIVAPVKIFTAGIDHLVDTAAASNFCSTLSNCAETHVPQARHCITREDFNVYDSLVDDVIAHFNATLLSVK